METYGNRSGHSGVRSFEVRPDGIVIAFRSGERYFYSISECGAETVDELIQHARKGKGLATYINQHIRDVCPVKLT